MQISYEYYKIFYYVAVNKSFTAAANALFMNQPNVTRMIKNLETQLGCILFSRSKRWVELTPEGEKLYGRVRTAVEQLQTAEEELALDKSLQKGIVTVGASDTALHGALLSVLKEYRRRYSGIKVKVSNFTTPQAMTALKNGAVDFSVVSDPLGSAQGAAVKEIRRYRDVVVAGQAFSALRGRKVSLRDLAEYPIVCMGRQTKTYEFYRDLFASAGAAFSPDIEAASTDQILPMVRNDLGIGFLPEFFLNGDLNDVFAVETEETIPARTICLIRRSDRSLSLAAKELERMLARGSGG